MKTQININKTLNEMRISNLSSNRLKCYNDILNIENQQLTIILERLASLQQDILDVKNEIDKANKKIQILA